ncbi:MAG: response regulator [Proteobacteria bacterium]|nr:response regulator [Pseudomonadota bacterium]MBU1717112.1 response regulator [Pseudomonadota bacterium]
MKILIVDDDRTIHLAYTKPLKKSGHEVLSAYDGPEALEMAVAHQPEIIVLDLTMPGMDGRDICKQLKNAPDTKQIKIIMLTAKDTQHDRLLGVELGADEYLTKPCSIFYLEMAINKIIRKM